MSEVTVLAGSAVAMRRAKAAPYTPYWNADRTEPCDLRHAAR